LRRLLASASNKLVPGERKPMAQGR